MVKTFLLFGMADNVSCRADGLVGAMQDKVTAAESRVHTAHRQLAQQRAELQALQCQSEVVAFLLMYVLFRMHSHRMAVRR
jgi:hypothetical protein